MPEAPVVPANIDAERSFLAAIGWVSQSDTAKARQLLQQSLIVPDRLYHPGHKLVLEEMDRLLDADQPVDAVALTARLGGEKAVAEAGGALWLSDLFGSVGYEHQIPVLAESIRQMALRRKLISVGRELQGKAADLEVDAAETMREASSQLAAITLTKRTVRTLEDVMGDVIDEWQELQCGGKPKIVPTGLAALDAIIGGWQPTLCLIGALPGVGKSAILASTVQAMATAGKRVGVFSLEDEARWIGWRLLSAESRVGQYSLRNLRLDDGKRKASVRALESIKLYAQRVLIDDRSGLSPRELVQTARDMVVNRGAEAIIVDHLGELRFEARHGERYDLEIMEGLSDLREIAKRHRVPVIVAAHLRRRQGLGPGDKPELSDFANSSAIERQARLALGLSRVPGTDALTVHVLKQTNGLAGVKVDLRFVGVAAMVRDCEGPIKTDWYEDQERQDGHGGTEVHGEE